MRISRRIRLPVLILFLAPSVSAHASNVYCVALSPDGKLLATGGEDFRLGDVTTGKVLHHAAIPGGEVFGVAIHPMASSSLTASPNDLEAREKATQRGNPCAHN